MKLNDEQFRAVASEHPLKVVIAGPGSGKTKTLTEAIKRRDGSSIMCVITFTNAAAYELRQRLEGVSLAYCGTLHGLGLRMLRRFHLEANYTEPPSITPDPEKWARLKSIRARLGLRLPDKELFVESPATKPIWDEYQFQLRWGNLVDYDGVLREFAALLLKREVLDELHIDDLFVDEAQDSAEIDWLIYERFPALNKFYVGDPDQCQPSETVVTTDAGPKRINALDGTDTVKAWDRNACRLTGGHAIKVGSRFYSGNLHNVGTGGRNTRCTPNHKWLVRWADRTSQVCVTYLMWRADYGFRLGWCQLFQHHAANASHGLHFFVRCRLEKAEKGWILGVHPDRLEASIEESILATEWQIPTICFEPRINNKLTKQAIERIFAASPARGEPLLRRFGRVFDLPLYSPNPKRSRTTYLEVHAANLLPKLHAVPLDDGKWHPIDTLVTAHFSGQVYSLNVARHHSYVADGIVTLNSIFAFRGAQPGGLNDMARRLEATVFTLQTNYRSDRSICRAADQLIACNPDRLAKTLEPVSPEEGNVEVIVHGDNFAEMQWISAKASSYLARSQTVGILSKRNQEAQRLLNYLEGAMGLPCERTLPARTPDYEAALLYLALLDAPNNRAIGARVLKLRHPEDEVEYMLLRADAGDSSLFAGAINSVLESTLHQDVPRYLAENHIEPATIAIIRQRANLLPDDASLTDLIQDLHTHQAEKRVDAPIYVGTLHSAKGREFDAVILAACEEGILPDARTPIEEERRLCFVGLTRARHEVIFSMVLIRTSKWDKTPVEQIASRFIQEAL